MDEPLRAHTLNEVRYYLMVSPCPACGKGPWVTDATRPTSRPSTGKPAEGTPAPSHVDAHCKQCGHRQTFSVLCEYALPETGAQAETINPDDRPSRIVDVGQWLSLFYMLIESASSQKDPVETRRVGYRAALCLAEALKFYGENQLPPQSAFFSAERLETFRKSPESFARQRLRDMQAKLPHLDVMARNVSRDDRRGGRKWWRFWR